MNTKANLDSFCVASVSSDVNVPLRPELLATHHILQDGHICLFRNDTKPNQKLVNGVWVDMYEDANVASWASRINQKPVIRNTVKVQASPIHPTKNVPGAYQGD